LLADLYFGFGYHASAKRWIRPTYTAWLSSESRAADGRNRFPLTMRARRYPTRPSPIFDISACYQQANQGTTPESWGEYWTKSICDCSWNGSQPGGNDDAEQRVTMGCLTIGPCLDFTWPWTTCTVLVGDWPNSTFKCTGHDYGGGPERIEVASSGNLDQAAFPRWTRTGMACAVEWNVPCWGERPAIGNEHCKAAGYESGTPYVAVQDQQYWNYLNVETIGATYAEDSPEAGCKAAALAWIDENKANMPQRIGVPPDDAAQNLDQLDRIELRRFYRVFNFHGSSPGAVPLTAVPPFVTLSSCYLKRSGRPITVYGSVWDCGIDLDLVVAHEIGEGPDVCPRLGIDSSAYWRARLFSQLEVDTGLGYWAEWPDGPPAGYTIENRDTATDRSRFPIVTDGDGVVDPIVFVWTDGRPFDDYPPFRFAWRGETGPLVDGTFGDVLDHDYAAGDTRLQVLCIALLSGLRGGFEVPARYSHPERSGDERVKAWGGSVRLSSEWPSPSP